jgi:hypothetical protein
MCCCAGCGWAASAALLLVLTGCFVHLALRMRRWQPAMVAGVLVLVTDEAGPAVVGLLRPRIILPLWVTRAPRAHQAAVLAHERSHLDARDPQLFTLALALLVVMPWNLPLWWQLRRLRRAIEIDCDARFSRWHQCRELRRSPLFRGRAPLHVHRRPCGDVRIPIISRTEVAHHVEQTRQMAPHRDRRARRYFPVLRRARGAAEPAGRARAAGDWRRCPTSRREPGPGWPRRDQTTGCHTERYVGDYAQSDSAFVTVKREGDHLLLDFSSGPKSEILAESEDHFFVKDGDARVVFANDGSGKAPSAPCGKWVARCRSRASTRHGRAIQGETAGTHAEPDACAANRSYAASPVRRHRGGQAQLRGHAAAAGGGAPPDLPKFMASYKQMGPIVSMKFAGVDGGGWDHYEVQRTNGRFQDSIIVGSDGKIAGYLTTQP